MFLAQVKRTLPPPPLCVLFTANGRQRQPGCTAACKRPARPLSLRSSGRREAARGCHVEDVAIRAVNDCRRAQWTRRACSLIIATHDSVVVRLTEADHATSMTHSAQCNTRPDRVTVFSSVFKCIFHRWRHNLFIYCQYCTQFVLHCGLGLVLVCIGMYLVTVCACHIEIKRYLLTYWVS